MKKQEKQLTFGIVGNGFIAPRHIEAINNIGGKLKWVCDDKICIIYDGEKPKITTKDYMDMDIPDYVSICTPNYLHHEMINFFACMGAKVLTEKPPVLKSSQIPQLDLHDVFVVLQLHYHPEIIRLKQTLNLDTAHKGFINVKVKRDQSYWDSWKGRPEQSGGILFNLGIHYLELLFYLFGERCKILNTHNINSRKVAGTLLFDDKHEFAYVFEISDTDDGQDRRLVIDGEDVSLSKKDNLSFENLHTKVYENMIAGNGIHIKECYNVVSLIEKINSI